MRHPKEHKAQVRERLLEASGHHAKAHGLAVSGAVRDAFDAGLAELHHQVARLLGSPQAGWSVLALCVGTVMLARASADPVTQRSLLEAAEAEVHRRLDAGAGP